MPHGKLHSCVRKVMATGKSRSSAYAICNKKLGLGKGKRRKRKRRKRKRKK